MSLAGLELQVLRGGGLGGAAGWQESGRAGWPGRSCDEDPPGKLDAS
ncbi:MAG: hypothetical protein WAW52_10565 [Methanothrix sp.]